MAGLYRFGSSTSLLSFGSVSTSQTGSAYLIKPDDCDRTDDKDMTFKAVATYTQSGGSSSPTVGVSIETSVDGVNWIVAATFTGRTTDGSTTETVALTTLLPYVRAKTTLGGGGLPAHTATVKLVADGPFTLGTV